MNYTQAQVLELMVDKKNPEYIILIEEQNQKLDSYLRAGNEAAFYLINVSKASLNVAKNLPSGAQTSNSTLKGMGTAALTGSPVLGYMVYDEQKKRNEEIENRRIENKRNYANAKAQYAYVESQYDQLKQIRDEYKKEYDQAVENTKKYIKKNIKKFKSIYNYETLTKKKYIFWESIGIKSGDIIDVNGTLYKIVPNGGNTLSKVGDTDIMIKYNQIMNKDFNNVSIEKLIDEIENSKYFTADKLIRDCREVANGIIDQAERIANEKTIESYNRAKEMLAPIADYKYVKSIMNRYDQEIEDIRKESFGYKIKPYLWWALLASVGLLLLTHSPLMLILIIVVLIFILVV